MKDNIFIIWSGSNSVALKIKQILETKRYKCTIGGNSDNSSTFSSIGDTVIQQMKTCNQAIVVFQNRADGAVSSNLYFELGYVLSSYSQPKVHCVRRASENVVLPSDFDNAFVEPIACANDDEFVEGIVKYFLDRQKMSITENKMLLINNRYRIHDYIVRHYSEKGSLCSDYELAQYLLFYMQAATMFGDEQKVFAELKKFKDEHQMDFSDELAIAVNMSVAFLTMWTNIKSADGGVFYLDKMTFRHFRETYEQCLAELMDDDMGTFDEWTKAFISEHLSYAYSIYAYNPDLTPEQKEKNILKCIYWAEKCLEDLRNLESVAHVKDNNDHKGFVSLFYAYNYRNLYLCHMELGDKETALSYLEKTRKERLALKNNFQAGSIDSHLYSNFEMEYFLALAEYLNYADEFELDEDDVEDYKAEISEYVKVSKHKTDISLYVKRIEYLIGE